MHGNAPGLAPFVMAALGWALMALVMLALWEVQRRRGDASVVDAAWTAGLGLLAVAYAVALPGVGGRRLLVAALAGLWSARLAVHLVRDRVIGKPEDPRYREMRRQWGARAQVEFFWYFQAQALAAALFSVPFLLAMRDPRPFPGIPDALATAVWLVAVGGESLADAQLARFRADPSNRGRTCRAGLWGWSRHPNYFFEWLHWWAYVPLALGAPWGWLSLLGPAAMLYLLFRVTGIPKNEARALETRGDDYRDYQRRTSVFIPLPPRRPPRDG
jgi:steroid 5-alpha reductase family enzyme